MEGGYIGNFSKSTNHGKRLKAEFAQVYTEQHKMQPHLAHVGFVLCASGAISQSTLAKVSDKKLLFFSGVLQCQVHMLWSLICYDFCIWYEKDPRNVGFG